jgi:hypothetical protein
MTTAPATTATAPRELVSTRMFDRLTRRVMADHGNGQTAAEQIMDQALAFLQACALNPAAGLAPSAEVDKGWHAFILHTADYAEFCQRTADRVIHHLPAEPGDQDNGGTAIHATMAAMRAAGLPVNTALWPASADYHSKCHHCHSGCHDSPGTGLSHILRWPAGQGACPARLRPQPAAAAGRSR